MNAIDRIGNVWARWAGRPVLRRLNLALFLLGSRGLGLGNNASFKISGEEWAIRRLLRPIGDPLVFDVGANEGVWLEMVLRLVPAARVHAFEPHPGSCERLRKRVPHVSIVNAGVGEREETMLLHDYDEGAGSTHASFVPGVIEGLHKALSTAIPARVLALDGYCEAVGVDQIDFLKVDVEGMELSVMKGAKRLFDRGAIRCVQFEFNEMNLVSRVNLGDFQSLFGPRYRLFRLLPAGLLPLDGYQRWMREQFIYQNIIAVRR